MTKPKVPQEWLSVLDHDERVALIVLNSNKPDGVRAWTSNLRHPLDAWLEQPLFASRSLDSLQALAAIPHFDFMAYIAAAELIEECEEEVTHERALEVMLLEEVCSLLSMRDFGWHETFAFEASLIVGHTRYLKLCEAVRSLAATFDIDLLQLINQVAERRELDGRGGYAACSNCHEVMTGHLLDWHGPRCNAHEAQAAMDS